MIIGEAETQSGHLVLIRWTRGLELYLDGIQLMSLSEARSESELARLGVERAVESLGRPIDALVLGLGLGVTVQELLDTDQVSRVVVAELFSALPGWLRRAPETSAIFADPRMSLVVADATSLPFSNKPCFDLILLDVGNGPLDPVIVGNAPLYGPPGLTMFRRYLRLGGVLGVWAAHRSEPFERALDQVFGSFQVQEVPLPSARPDLEPDLVYLMTRSG